MSSIVKYLYLTCIVLIVDKNSISAVEFPDPSRPRNNAILSPVIFREDRPPHYNISQPTTVTFNAAHPSPALVSPGPPRVRFLDELVPSPPTHSYSYPAAPHVQGSVNSTVEASLKSPRFQPNSTRTSGTHIPGSQLISRPNIPNANDLKVRSVSSIGLHGSVEKQLEFAVASETDGRAQTQAVGAKNEDSRIGEGIYANDRWSWPRQPLHSTSREANARGPTIPLPHAKQLVPLTIERNNATHLSTAPSNLVKVFTKLSRCPKLFADVDLLCTITPLNYPVVLSWKKRSFSGNNSTDHEVLISQGNVKRTQESRYSIISTGSPANTVLRINALKSSDCGTYKCEARDRQGTILGSSDVLVFMCL